MSKWIILALVSLGGIVHFIVATESVLQPTKNMVSASATILLDSVVPPLAPITPMDRGCVSGMLPFPEMVVPTGKS